MVPKSVVGAYRVLWMFLKDSDSSCSLYNVFKFSQVAPHGFQKSRLVRTKFADPRLELTQAPPVDKI